MSQEIARTVQIFAYKNHGHNPQIYLFFFLPECLSVLNVTVISAKLHGVGGLFSKPPDVYVELIVDSVTSRKTAVRKKTNAPQWDEQIQVS